MALRLDQTVTSDWKKRLADAGGLSGRQYQKPQVNGGSLKKYNPADYNNSGWSTANNSAKEQANQQASKPSTTMPSSSRNDDYYYDEGDGYVSEAEIDREDRRAYIRWLREQSQMKNKLEQQRREAEEARRRAIEQAVAGMEQYRPMIGQERDRLLQQSYVRQQQSLKNLPQQMAASGYGNGGLAESSMVGIDTQYGSEANEAEIAYQQALAKLNSDIAQVRANGELSIAESGDSYAQMLTQLEMQQMQQQAALEQQRLAAALKGAYSAGRGSSGRIANQALVGSADDSNSGSGSPGKTITQDSLLNYGRGPINQNYYNALALADGNVNLLDLLRQKRQSELAQLGGFPAY